MRNEKDGRFIRSLIYGVGIDDVEGTKECVDKTGKRSTDKCFSTWKNMLRRCYHEKGEYKGKVTVCDDWFTYSNYKKWYDENYKPNCEMDKDICGGSCYSPSTCLFIPREINIFVTNCNNECGFYFEESRNKYQSYCSKYKGKRKNIGRFDTKEEAVMHSKLFKISEINKLMSSIDDISLKIKLSELCDRMFLRFVLPEIKQVGNCTFLDTGGVFRKHSNEYKFSIVNLKDYC